MKHALSILFLLTGILLAEVREVYLLQTTDTHARLSSVHAGEACWPQLATLIGRETRAIGPGKWLLVDCGDTVQGSIIASLTRGEAALQPILALPYDAWIPGNHELDFGPQRAAELFALAGDKLLCGNFAVQDHPRPRAWRIFERNGLRLAVIGMQASYFLHWLLPGQYRQCIVEKAEEVLPRILPEITKQKPDVIILAIHQAWFEGRDPRAVNEVNSIATHFPEIDLILGAHSHRNIPGCKVGLKTWYVQAGCHCKSLGVVKVTADNERHQVLDIESCLREVTSDTPSDPVLTDILAPWVDRENSYATEDTGIRLTHGVSSAGRPGLGCQTSELIARAMAEAVGADLAFHGRLSNASLAPGPLTRRDLHELVPYDNTIVIATFTQDELEAIMDEQWKQRESYRYCGPWNAWFEVSNGQGRAVLLGTGPDKTPPKPGQTWQVAFNSHTAAGSGTFLTLRYFLNSKRARLKETDLNTRDAVERYLKKHQGDPGKTTFWLNITRP